MNRVAAVTCGALALASCSNAGPDPAFAGPPYLAIVAKLDVPAGVTPGESYRFAVAELSGTVGVDTVIVAAPEDTVILSVSPATYRVGLEGVPGNCAIRDGAERFVEVPEGANTAIARFPVSCRAPLVVETATDGGVVDDQFYVRITGPGSAERLIVVTGNDTLRVDSLPPGGYTVELGAVAANCEVTSDGRERRHVEVTGAGGARVAFRVRCSEPDRRPVLTRFEGALTEGGAGFYFMAWDPDRDIERYTFDVSDCAGTSLLPRGPRTRRGLSSGRTSRADSVVIIGAYELAQLPASPEQCLSVRVEDERGNTTAWVDRRTGGLNAGAAPVFVSAGLGFRGTSAIEVSVAVDDRDGDFVGLFPMARLSDGALGPPDGEADIGAFNATGYLAPPLPDIPLGNGRPNLADYRAVILYAVDRRGNVSRRELPVF